MSEMKTITLNGKLYDSFVDAKARQAIENIGEIGVGSGGSISATDDGNGNVVVTMAGMSDAEIEASWEAGY